MLRIRGYALPDAEPVDPYADAAGSWAARTFLGVAGLVPGAPADAVVYDADPRADLTVLDRPLAVISRGRPVHRA